MADTSRIKTEIEPFVREWLSKRCGGLLLSERSVSLPSGGTYSFDAVSNDGLFVAAILCNRPKTRTGRENTGGVRKALAEIEHLKQLSKEVKKMMVFTDLEFCDLIQRRAKRFGTAGIEMLVCTLSPEKEKVLQQVLDQASYEQRAADEGTSRKI